ncbi:MAG: hypothetical protein ACYC05_05020 [Sulfuricella sp.]
MFTNKKHDEGFIRVIDPAIKQFKHRRSRAGGNPVLMITPGFRVKPGMTVFDGRINNSCPFALIRG